MKELFDEIPIFAFNTSIKTLPFRHLQAAPLVINIDG